MAPSNFVKDRGGEHPDKGRTELGNMTVKRVREGRGELWVFSNCNNDDDIKINGMCLNQVFALGRFARGRFCFGSLTSSIYIVNEKTVLAVSV